MNGTNQEQKSSGRTGKTGILTDMEREYLTKKRNYNQKQKWTFRDLLLSRINACTKDIQLIWESDEESLKKWLYDNWSSLYTFGERVKPRHYSELYHYRPGHIKTTIRKTRKGKKDVTLYWLDESDKQHVSYNDLPWPDHLVRKVKRQKIKQILSTAFCLEEEFWYRDNPPNGKDLQETIVPRSKEEAINIYDIEKKIQKFQRKLKQ